MTIQTGRGGRAVVEGLERRLSLAADFSQLLTFGGPTGEVEIRDVATDSGGNQVIAGTFQGRVNFNPYAQSPGRAGLRSTRGGRASDFVGWYNGRSGFANWVYQLPAGVHVTAVTAAAENVYVVGYFSGTLTLGGRELSSEGGEDGFVLALSGGGGVIQFVSQMGGAGDDRIADVAVGRGGIAVTGSFEGTFDAAPGRARVVLTSEGGTDAFTAVLSQFGRLRWAAQQGGAGADRGVSVDVDRHGNAYVAGTFTGGADLRPGKGQTFVSSGGEPGIPNTNAYVCRLNPAGKLAWATTFGQSEDDYAATQVAFAPDKSVYVLGTFSGNADFGTFVGHLSANGDVLLERLKSFAAGTDTGLAVSPATGNVYVSGWFRGRVDTDFGPNGHILTSAGERDAYLIEMNPALDFVRSLRFGAAGDDLATIVRVDRSGDPHLGGSFEGVVDFDPLAPAVLRDSEVDGGAWVLRLTA